MQGILTPFSSDGKPLCLDDLAAMPDPLASLEAWERHEHRDLAHLSPLELRAEEERLRLRLLIDEDPSAWLIERLARVREALSHAT